MQDALVMAQVALSLMLLVAGSMAIRSSIRSASVDTGYETKRVLLLQPDFPDTMKYGIPRRRLLIDRLRQQLAAMPGVSSVSNAPPPGDSGPRTAAAALGEKARRAETVVHYSLVEPNYFETLSIPIVRGRGFAGEDQRSVVLSESAAAELWPGQDPVGRLLQLGVTDGRFHDLRDLAADGAIYTVQGVAHDTRAVDFNASDSRRVYLPMPADRLHSYPVLIRTSGEPVKVLASLDALITSIDPNMPATCATLEDLQRQSGPFIVAALTAMTASSIGLIGVLLALLGIHGTVSYLVVTRTREVGIRMAIGAQPRDVLRLILRDTTRPILVGLMIGTSVAAVLSHLARGLLYGLDRIDWISLGVTAPLFLIIGLLASFHPALRATRVDPQVALRYE
jgi:predicted permease